MILDKYIKNEVFDDLELYNDIDDLIYKCCHEYKLVISEFYITIKFGVLDIYINHNMNDTDIYYTTRLFEETFGEPSCVYFDNENPPIDAGVRTFNITYFLDEDKYKTLKSETTGEKPKSKYTKLIARRIF